ncbi:putative leucine-rich repeat-containing protein DDB_G0290503 [Syngnathoides biaculeatus]|uniref:putative leucine-rich repeat-containing protein DDB_G0290503 n=1 Tax=Syngnathoides biaculeatus TaxID=300417 RepID=UPI002ADE1CBD|nr:putative leucine-rich repeat-containing protein DDB_G0290503 [Syngnathoides biaculeatus]XP_061676457.1 putative leucine-rich repeat-containing protein DDB_G0290503 [Syngnathoides biaculeatus]XP_061676458.1 putative leucine-rich repeat-containing protein DDB_G0290503 [Syngnathoides biaculeatus]
MSSQCPNDLCVICGVALQGNQRRWLFGGQHKKSIWAQTPKRSLRTGSLSGSSPSTPWSSMTSLCSSSSLSKSQLSLSSQSKSLDLLSVLTHILGGPVSRAVGRGEFVCGKCSGVLERVFRFDTVIARVRALSSERLNKLTHERDRVRRWVRSNYVRRHPREQGEEEEEEEGGDEDKDDYRDMLKDNMALAEYECWSEKWDTCPYFIRTGKRCRKGQNCEGCDSLRVSDSDYESVCGVPRRMPYQAFSPLLLSRDKSQSMPLHWHRIPSTCSSPASLAASTFSLRTPSIQSLDSLDNFDISDSLGYRSVSSVLREIRRLGGRPVRSPVGSKIPVLAGRSRRRSSSEMTSPVVNRNLSFEENGGHHTEEEQEEEDDVLMEMKDEFLPLHQQGASRRLHQVVRHLRGQLDQAEARIRTLEAQLKPEILHDDDATKDWTHIVREEDAASLLPGLARSLHSRDRLIQECMSVIRRVCAEGGGKGQLADQIAKKLSENLKEIVSDNKSTMESFVLELVEKERHLEEEVSSLRKAAGDREKDLDTLNMVLQCNQDIIDELHVALDEKQRLLQELENEREVWSQRDRALAATMQEKDELVRVLKVELESSMKDVQALSDSVIGQGLLGGGAEASLASQLQEKQSHLAALLEEREKQSATLCQEVTKLTAALQEYQNVVQSQQESYERTTSSLTARLTDARRALRDEERRRKEAERTRHNQREDGKRAERKLRDSLEKRDQIIQQILQDAEERDRQLVELQHNLQKRRDEYVSAVKHAL